jgi:hypothetical protein
MGGIRSVMLRIGDVSERPAIEIAATQTKSAYADSRHLQPAQAGFGAVAAISIA